MDTSLLKKGTPPPRSHTHHPLQLFDQCKNTKERAHLEQTADLVLECVAPLKEVVVEDAGHARVCQDVGVALADLVVGEGPVDLSAAGVMVVNEGLGGTATTEDGGQMVAAFNLLMEHRLLIHLLLYVIWFSLGTIRSGSVVEEVQLCNQSADCLLPGNRTCHNASAHISSTVLTTLLLGHQPSRPEGLFWASASRQYSHLPTAYCKHRHPAKHIDQNLAPLQAWLTLTAAKYYISKSRRFALQRFSAGSGLPEGMHCSAICSSALPSQPYSTSHKHAAHTAELCPQPHLQDALCWEVKCSSRGLVTIQPVDNALACSILVVGQHTTILPVHVRPELPHIHLIASTTLVDVLTDEATAVALQVAGIKHWHQMAVRDTQLHTKHWLYKHQTCGFLAPTNLLGITPRWNQHCALHLHSAAINSST